MLVNMFGRLALAAAKRTMKDRLGDPAIAASKIAAKAAVKAHESDDGKSIFVHLDDGTVVSLRHYGAEWHSRSPRRSVRR